MPTLREAALAVAGQIISVEDVRDRDGKFSGMRCVISTGDGFTQTRLAPEPAAFLKPELGQSVVWMLRPGALMGDNGDIVFFTAFVREATENDLDRIVSASRVAVSK